MMLVPRKNSFDLFDDFFDDDFFPKKEKNLMKTDIREKKGKYIIDMDLPGFEKENIEISLEKGYLIINAKVNKHEKDSDEKFVRRERFYGECSRSFYIGEDVKENEINASFKNGTLMIEIPKKVLEDQTKKVKQIEIK